MSVYSTGQVARICKVARNTVCKWFDSGELEGYRNGPQNDRCIPGRSLIVFLKKHKIPFILWHGKIYTDDSYTTGQVARISRLHVSTIIRLFNSGCLRGFCIPGSGFRRIPLFFFISFLEKYGLSSDGIKNLISPQKRTSSLISSPV